ncbi:hypothetical protein KSP39_PZI008297 [Platanthera zijinensis]|uniref:Uncharacterized protein n=1 Tax=Platanthera zijinensis TaxID=2320716 RepID=A0AAP0BPL9_9ASPA
MEVFALGLAPAQGRREGPSPAFGFGGEALRDLPGEWWDLPAEALGQSFDLSSQSRVEIREKYASAAPCVEAYGGLGQEETPQVEQQAMQLDSQARTTGPKGTVPSLPSVTDVSERDFVVALRGNYIYVL